VPRKQSKGRPRPAANLSVRSIFNDDKPKRPSPQNDGKHLFVDPATGKGWSD